MKWKLIGTAFANVLWRWLPCILNALAAAVASRGRRPQGHP